jgi:cytochrome P450
MVLVMSFAFDPFSREARENPYPAYRLMLDDGALRAYRNDDRAFVAVSRYDDAVGVLRDWSTFSSAKGVEIDASSSEFGEGVFLEEDPPVHKQLRGVIHADFSPKVIRELDGQVRAQVNAFLEDLTAAAEPDFGDLVTWRLPTFTISALMGLPPEDLEWLTEVEERFQRRVVGQVTPPDDAAEASRELCDYFTRHLEERRRTPSEGLLSTIANATVDGEPVGEAALGLALIVFTAAADTTACLLSNALYHLEAHPEQRDWLRANLDQIPAAIEEVLRFDSPLQVTKRVASTDTSLAGVDIPADTDVYVLYGAANRDQRRFERPDAFDIRREAKRNLAFGEGIHHCIGAPLARLEARVFLECVLTQMPNYSLLASTTRFESHMMRGYRCLPVDPASLHSRAGARS